jgi:1,4-alpha-glucan branching enzyme
LSGFARWCRERRIAVLQTTELYSNIFGLPGAALGNVPVRIGSRREINPDKTAGQIVAQRAAYTLAHKVVANSLAGAIRLRQEQVPQSKVSIVRNGLDVGSSPTGMRRTPPRKVIVVANLRREKAHDVLIDAAPYVLRHFPDAQFEIVGAGPERDPLLERARARAVSHAFSFAGHCDDVPRRLAEADIFVLPSTSEAFPNAVLEAMGAGLPVVASAVGGILEMVEHDRTGLLVEPGNHAQLGQSLCALMDDSSRSARLGAAARADVLARYSFERMVRAFESLYLHELASRGLIGAATPQLAAT